MGWVYDVVDGIVYSFEPAGWFMRHWLLVCRIGLGCDELGLYWYCFVRLMLLVQQAVCCF